MFSLNLCAVLVVCILYVFRAHAIQSCDSGNWLITFEPSAQNITEHMKKYHKKGLGRTFNIDSSKWKGKSNGKSNGRDKKYRAYSAGMTSEEAAGIRSLSYIKNVECDAVMTMAAESMCAVQSHAGYNLNRLTGGSVPEYTYSTYSYPSGAGTSVDIYILDTGVDASNPDFGGRVVALEDFSGSGTGDRQGHGTHVAGIAGSFTYGVAKNATIFDVKVLGDNGSGPMSNVIAGVQYAYNRISTQGKAAVINISIVGPLSQALNDAIEVITSAGVPVVVAAGNESTDSCTKSPASAPGVITVGCTDRTDERTSFSNYGKCVTVFAPGNLIISLSNKKEEGVAVLSGTSMSSPLVAGFVALILEANDKADSASIIKYITATSYLDVVKNPGWYSPNLLVHMDCGNLDITNLERPSSNSLQLSVSAIWIVSIMIISLVV